jgi:hypothetical protein
MRVRPLAALAVLGATLIAGAAHADSGTYSGAFTATACGPKHPISVAAGETTIDASASAAVVANDITIDLYSPAGALLQHGDTGTSPETIHYASASLAPGTYTVQVCPFVGALLVAPYDYVGTFATSSAPVVGVPGSDPGAAGGAPQPKYVAGKLGFSTATVVDPQRTEGEPLNFVDKNGNYWESGPFGTSTQNSWIHRSTDGGLEFHVDSAIGARPDAPPGGGDTDVVADDQGYAYFTDLEALLNLGTSVSNDGGQSWRKNPAAVANVAVDRQWYAVDNGPTAGAADNSIFLAFHMSAVGTFIYSSPGSTGSSDPVGGLVWMNSSAAAPVPLAGDATCGQLRFDPVKRNLYYACNEGTHVRVTIGHVAPGQRTGIVYRNVTAPVSPGGGDVGNLFPALSVDAAGTVYVGWIDESDHNVYYSYSTDEGTSWSTAVRLNSGPAVTNEFLWSQAGASGSVGFAWLGTDRAGNSDTFPNWDSDPQGATAVKWYGYYAGVTSAASKKPTIAQQRFTNKPTHYGQICNGGIGCTTTSGDRTMADYFGFTTDGKGALRIVMNDTTSQHHAAHLIELRQLQGKTLAGTSLNDVAPASPVGDESGDAQWPHYGPTAPGPNVPQLDFTSLAVGKPDSATLRVKIGVASLASLLPPAGKTSAAWITRFQALSQGDHGEESYRIFFVGAESTGGLAPRYFAGSTTCTNTDPGNCKIVQYPAGQTVPGRVCGNALVIDAPLAAFGKAITGDRLYSVTALGVGRNGTDDLYADVDATHSFDYVLGSGPAPSC